MKEVIAHRLFSTPVYESVLSISNNEVQQIRSYIKSLDYYEMGASKKNNVLGNLLKLKNHILEEFNIFKNEVLCYENVKFKFSTSWATKIDPDQNTSMHRHSNCFFSGTYYPFLDDEFSSIRFFNTNLNDWDIVPSKYNSINSKSFDIKVSKNKLLFFPNNLYHQIISSDINKTRYSIAFNFFPVGTIGRNDSLIEI